VLPKYCAVQSSCLSVASVLVLLRVAASNAGSKLWLVGLVLAVFGFCYLISLRSRLVEEH